MYRCVIFDLDGTLLNTLDDLADAGNYVCRQMGWPEHPVDAYQYFVGNGIEKLVERMTPPEHRRPDVLKTAFDAFVARYDAHKEDKTLPYPGIPTLLSRLEEEGVRMAVLTNKAHHLAKGVVERYFPGVFPCVQGAMPGQPTKPDPTLLRLLMERMGAVEGETIFVGDSGVDVRTAKNAGLPCCGVLWGFRTRQELLDEGADALAEDSGQLAELILH